MAKDMCLIELEVVDVEPINIATGIIEWKCVYGEGVEQKLEELDSIANHLKEYVRWQRKMMGIHE